MKNILFLIGLCLSIPIFAQDKTAKDVVGGIVKDIEGEPIIGATVLEISSTNGTITDIDGQFSLTLKSKSPRLSISYIGYETQIVKVDGKTNLTIVLKEDAKILDEVVVTGYSGTQLRSKVTSSTAKVDKETFEIGLFTNPAQALSGAVSGVRVTQSSGNPGSTPTIILR